MTGIMGMIRLLLDTLRRAGAGNVRIVQADVTAPLPLKSLPALVHCKCG